MRSGIRVLAGIWVLLLALCTASGAFARTKAGSLEYGDKGDDVLRLQQALETLGYQPGKVDGTFGAYTENALRRFQKANGLSVDGIAGAKTVELLYALSGQTAAVTVTQPVQTAVPQPAQESQSAVTRSDGSFFGGNYASMYPGQTGTRVVLLQNALNLLGYNCGMADGTYGEQTVQAVKAFQKANSLTEDGIAGKKTLKKMENLRNPPAAAAVQPVQSSDTSLSSGMSGSAVSSLQQKLKDLGYYTGTVDGVYGSGTLSAVIAFQASHGLTADGVAGSRTLSALASANAVTAQTAVQPVVVQTAVQTAQAASYRNLKLNATGADVTNLQTALLRLSYPVAVTGTYDAATRTAVRSFQQRNGLTVDGVAGKLTQTRLFSSGAVAADTSKASAGSTTESTSVRTETAVTATGPSGSQIRLLHWFNDIKPSLKSGQNLLVYDPQTKISWTLRIYSLGRHADCEPLTAEDTSNMVKAFGGVNTWNQKAVYVQLPGGTWTLGSTHDMPHLSGSIKDNNFNGHLCVHFLRDMDECQKNDPKYGVANQNTIRSAWKTLTGQDVE